MADSDSPHPLLAALQAFLVRSEPAPDWRVEQTLAVGVATPLEAHWLVATNVQGRVLTRLGTDAPREPRAALVVDAGAADHLLGGAPRGRVSVLGDKPFLERTLRGCLLAGSGLNLRAVLSRSGGEQR
jgi:hypothetical protein